MTPRNSKAVPKGFLKRPVLGPDEYFSKNILDFLFWHEFFENICIFFMIILLK
jgi:hypothetical protein